MENKIKIAFFGIDNFDYILYLTRILHRLEKKVLIIDRSETGSLERVMPAPVGVDPANEIITYRKVDFTKSDLPKDRLDEYDVVLTQYGFKDPGDELLMYDRLMIVTDLYLSNVNRINDTPFKLRDDAECCLLVRNVVDTKITPYAIAEKIALDIPADNKLFLYFEYQDHANAIICQSNQVPRFTKISRQLRRMLVDDVMSIYPNIPKKACIKACKKAKKGE